jgi:membrane-bound lytic murein transglycosylase B
MMKRPLATLLLILLFAAPARAAQCSGDFNVFLSAMVRDARAAGLPRGIIDQAFVGVTIDPAVRPIAYAANDFCHQLSGGAQGPDPVQALLQDGPPFAGQTPLMLGTML